MPWHSPLNTTKSTIHCLLIKTIDKKQLEAYLLPYISKSDLTKQMTLHTGKMTDLSIAI